MGVFIALCFFPRTLSWTINAKAFEDHNFEEMSSSQITGNCNNLVYEQTCLCLDFSFTLKSYLKRLHAWIFIYSGKSEHQKLQNWRMKIVKTDQIRIKIQKKSTLRKKYNKQIHKKETIIANINQIKSSNRFYIYI